MVSNQIAAVLVIKRLCMSEVHKSEYSARQIIKLMILFLCDLFGYVQFEKKRGGAVCLRAAMFCLKGLSHYYEHNI